MAMQNETTIQCEKCGAANPKAARFCTSCGAALTPANSDGDGPRVAAPGVAPMETVSVNGGGPAGVTGPTTVLPQPAVAAVLADGHGLAGVDTDGKPDVPTTEIDARHARKLLERASKLAERGDVEAAVVATRQSIALVPDSPYAFELLAGLLRRAHEWDGAIEAYEGLLKLEPGREDAIKGIEEVRAARIAQPEPVAAMADEELFQVSETEGADPLIDDRVVTGPEPGGRAGLPAAAPTSSQSRAATDPRRLAIWLVPVVAVVLLGVIVLASTRRKPEGDTVQGTTLPAPRAGGEVANAGSSGLAPATSVIDNTVIVENPPPGAPPPAGSGGRPVRDYPPVGARNPGAPAIPGSPVPHVAPPGGGAPIMRPPVSSSVPPSGAGSAPGNSALPFQMRSTPIAPVQVESGVQPNVKAPGGRAPSGTQPQFAP